MASVHAADRAPWLGGLQSMMDHVGTWPALTDEQYAVIVTALDEAAMAHIMDEFRARQRWAGAWDRLRA
ncbi:hypothetical protein OHA72_46170 [Dactylosporangium sp. NBC_01737]|uniref:hypothetical protein n=1 Tax=Dactylosporangium sp. NBC_01737 TaxID=2975959 RepID=UPI002E126C29|nr:hypothetical protein OHA72_46170 [Dactylosporangium sp. NBC_01737]